jgi:small subunit ribosomal protein S2
MSQPRCSIIDTTREQMPNEARRLGIPTVAIVDTNADPEAIDYHSRKRRCHPPPVMLQKLVDAIVSASGEARMREEVEMAGVSA